jgi:LAO/AO transport system kinase
MARGAEPLDLERVRAGGKRAIAAALAAIEQKPLEAGVVSLLDAAFAAPRGHVIGITGPPGVGKSSLANALVSLWRKRSETVGLVAVDPSSRVSGGALLGDRTRFSGEVGDPGVYFRSLAARGRLGGLSDLAFPAVVLFRALFDRVIVESVGVGQSEAAITTVADTVLLCVQPGSGDSLQFMKAGIMEIPHIAAVTKSDVGAAARRAEAELKGALSLTSGGEAIDVLSVSATAGTGLEELDQAIGRLWTRFSAADVSRQSRQRQAEEWLRDAVRNEIGQRGEEAARGLLALEPGQSPFRRAAQVLALIDIVVAKA